MFEVIKVVRATKRLSQSRLGLQAAFAALIISPLLLSQVTAQEAAPAINPAASVAVTSQAVTPAPAPRFEMVDAAARYAALLREADRMTFPNALASESIASSLTTTARLTSKEITEGAGAYAVLTVASDPAFRSGVQTAVGFLGKDVALARLKENPASFLAMISGSQEATKIASGALSSSEAKLKAAQTKLGEAAYSLQKERWANMEVDTQATLAAHRAAAREPSGLTPFSASDLPANVSDDPVNSRYVLAATYRLLGDDASATAMLDKPLGRMCMNRVQLNVRQCVAASRFPYEHAFCLAQHSFGETLSCVQDAVK
jgi:hypothetical protein